MQHLRNNRICGMLCSALRSYRYWEGKSRLHLQGSKCRKLSEKAMKFKRHTASIGEVTYRFRAVQTSDLVRHNLNDTRHDIDSKNPFLLDRDGNLKCNESTLLKKISSLTLEYMGASRSAKVNTMK